MKCTVTVQNQATMLLFVLHGIQGHYKIIKSPEKSNESFTSPGKNGIRGYTYKIKLAKNEQWRQRVK